MYFKTALLEFEIKKIKIKLKSNFILWFTCKELPEMNKRKVTDPRTINEKPLLPSFMLLDARTGDWTFRSETNKCKPLDTIRYLIGNSNQIQCSYVEWLPKCNYLYERAYEIYGDEEGMLKHLHMNVSFNPLCTDEQIIRLASYGGPFGSLVLYRKGGINLDDLQKLCRDYDRKMMESDGEDPAYSEMLAEAIQNYQMMIMTTTTTTTDGEIEDSNQKTVKKSKK